MEMWRNGMSTIALMHPYPQNFAGILLVATYPITIKFVTGNAGFD
jgi:predicted peptidase